MSASSWLRDLNCLLKDKTKGSLTKVDFPIDFSLVSQMKCGLTTLCTEQRKNKKEEKDKSFCTLKLFCVLHHF